MYAAFSRVSQVEGASMENFNFRCMVSRSCLPTLFVIGLAGMLAGCQRSADNPMDPQAPPKPQAYSPPSDSPAPAISDDGIVRAVFKYSSTPLIHFQNGQGVPIKAHVIRT